MAGVYVSYPFCAQKCTYCNFASGVLPRELERRYVDALCLETLRHAWRWTPETVYLGGGTPSQMDPAALGRVLASIPGAPWREATIEASPGTITLEKALAWCAAGIDRVSLGVQSFNTRELKRTGRKHTADTVARDVAALRTAGILNLSLDLIAGLPGQTMDTWNESLKWIERLAPPHVSLYMLEIDEDSRLGQEVLLNGKRYGAPDVPADALIVEMYERGVDALRGMGLPRYEISNFARPSFESLHNLKYWQLAPYAGFGADAHSFDGVVRSQNVEAAVEYVERVEHGERPLAGSVPANSSEERFFVGLRLAQGICPLPEEWSMFEAPIARFVASGMLTREGGRLRLTDRGVLFSNEVFEEFVGA